jgi:hypothetical protein
VDDLDAQRFQVGDHGQLAAVRSTSDRGGVERRRLLVEPPSGFAQAHLELIHR